MWGADMMGWGWSGGWGWFGMIHMLLWWLLIVAGIGVLLKWLIGGRSGSADTTHRRALEILAERYARGEIDKAEFEDKKRDLRS